jgi:hypothetical protein
VRDFPQIELPFTTLKPDFRLSSLYDGFLMAEQEPPTSPLRPELVRHDKPVGDTFTDDKGREWVTLKIAAERTGEKKRNLEFWTNPGQGKTPKVPGQQIGTGGRAPWYVDMKALEEFLDDESAKRKPRSQLPVPTTSEFATAIERVGFMEGQNQALEMRVSELRDEKERLESELREVRKSNEDRFASQIHEIEQRLTKQIEQVQSDGEAARLRAENDQLRAELETLKAAPANVVDLTESELETEKITSGKKRGPIGRFFMGDS